MPKSPTKRRQSSAKVGPELSANDGPKQTVVFVKDELFQTKDIRMIKLRHPRTNSDAMFVLDECDKKLYQLWNYDETHRSWLIGNSVQSDGRIFITIPVDPLYMILPYLTKATQNVPLDHLLMDSEYPNTNALALLALPEMLHQIADPKGSADLGIWRYNESLALTLLEKRVTKLAPALLEKRVPTSSAQSLTFVRTMNSAEMLKSYTALAHEIVSEYLSAEMSLTLRRHLKLPEVTSKSKAVKGTENLPSNKKQKMEGPNDDYTVNKVATEKVKVQSTKEKALAKSAVGSKNIMAFFGKGKK